MARTGKTREHYLKQKSQAFAYFRVRQEDAQRISSGQFTVFDFISNCFSFSTAKKQVAADVLASLKREPQTFKQLQEALGVGKSTLFLVVLALERAGLVEKQGKNRPLRLSREFSQALNAYALWWSGWSEQTLG
ncbi:MAG TPA: helix-turn-helix domain-containing protein [Candidatus Norongarragalinales archaeon]|nr:helix-turn-helix domain-containing protein [Candidatus Norongarragalinales archaeon]